MSNGLFTVTLNEARLRDVLPPSHLSKINKYPRQKALALLGDRLIDLKLYEQLLLEGEKNEGMISNLLQCHFSLYSVCILLLCNV